MSLPIENTVRLYASATEVELSLPLVTGGISAGFPSPALDFVDVSIDMNKYLIKHPSATFYGRVKGDSLRNAGIDDGDLLVIDRSLALTAGKIAVCYVDGEFTAKRVEVRGDTIWLMPANEKYQPIKVTAEQDFLVWGVVTHVIKSV